jgi:hypothetical protein
MIHVLRIKRPRRDGLPAIAKTISRVLLGLPVERVDHYTYRLETRNATDENRLKKWLESVGAKEVS